ncbi:MAG: matrixin family metalloprotease [Pirellulales bacterium]
MTQHDSSNPAPLTASRRPAPFPGATPFSEFDAARFFGRTAEVRDLLKQWRRTRFAAVTGPEGVGKTSFVQAGVLPALTSVDGADEAARRWWRIHFRVEENPVRELAAAVWRASRAAGGETTATADSPEQQAAELRFLEATLRSGDLGLVRALNDHGLRPDDGVVIWVERADDLFARYTAKQSGIGNRTSPIEAGWDADADDVQTLVDLLLAAADHPARHIRVLVALSDSIAQRCAAAPRLNTAVESGRFELSALSREALREAIEGALQTSGATADSALVEQALDDAQALTCPLVGLQHALVRTWQRASQRRTTGDVRLTLDDYLATGGAEQAIARQVVELIDELSGEGPLRQGGGASNRRAKSPDASASRTAYVAVARQVQRLLAPEETTSSKSVLLEQIAAAAAVPVPIAARFVAALAGPECRLVAVDALDAESLLPETRVALAHPSVARYWPESFERPASRSSSSQPAKSVMNTPTPSVREPRRDRGARGAATGSRSWRPLFAVWALAVVATLSIGAVQWVMESMRERRLAADGSGDVQVPEQAKAPPSEPATAPPAASGGAPATPIADLPQGDERRRVQRAERSVALSAAQRDSNPVLSLLFAAEAARSLAVADHRPEALDQAWRDAVARCMGRSLAGHSEPVRRVAVSADERWVATVAETCRLWDLQQPNLAQSSTPLALPEVRTPAGDLPPNRAAVEAQRGPNASSIIAIRILESPPRIEAVLSEGLLWRWSLHDPGQLPAVERLEGETSPLRHVAFRPGSEDFVATDESGAVRYWRRTAENGPLAPPVTLARGGVRQAAFNSAGTHLATAGGLTQVWSLDQLAPTLAGTLLAPEHQEFTKCAISATGRWVAAVDAANNVFVWDWEAARTEGAPIVVDNQPERAEGRSGGVTEMAFDPLERWLAIAADDRLVHAWPLAATPDQPAGGGVWVLTHPAPVRGLATTSDGRWLFSSSDDGAVRAWVMPPPTAVSTPIAVWPGVAGRRGELVGSPAGALLATVDGDGQARVWDTLTASDIQGQFLLPPGYAPASDWAWSRAGDRVAAAVHGDDRTQVVVWRTNDDRGWIPETGLAVPPELSAGPLELRWDAAGQTLVGLSGTPSSERREFVVWRLPSLRESREIGLPFSSAYRPQAHALQLTESFQDLQFGPRGLVLLGPTGQLRAWKFVDGDGRYVERNVPAHEPAVAVQIAPDGSRLALLHRPAAASDSPPQRLVSLWGPEGAQAEWTQQGYWELPSARENDDPLLALNERWLIVRAGSEQVDGATMERTPMLYGWRIDQHPPADWRLAVRAPRRVQLSLEGDRLLVEGPDEATVYALGDQPKPLHTLRYAESEQATSAWSSDGRWLAREHATGGVELWDLARVGVTGRVLLSSPPPKSRLLFTRGDRWLASLHPEGFVGRWPCAWDALVAAAQRAAGRNLTLEEWAAAFPEQRDRFEETFAGLGPGQVAQAARRPEEPNRAAVAARPPLEDGVIRFAIESVPTLPDEADAAEIVRAAWQAWADTDVIAFREVELSQHPHIIIRTERLDGPEGVPGHGQQGPPQEGLRLELRFDSEATWTADLLQLVAVHELGHLLGLTHTATPGQLMSEAVPDGVRTPQEEDVRRLRELWTSP